MGYSPMAAGILTGKYRKGERERATDLKASVLYADDPNTDTAIDAVSSVAQEVGAKPGQVAVAWVKAKGVLPIVGTRTREQLEEHLGALSVTLSDDQIRRLDAATAIALGYPHELNCSSGQREVMTGGRFEQIDYPHAAQQKSDRDEHAVCAEERAWS
jgi:diketogulonate reductase-like aldo/keto reductase